MNGTNKKKIYSTSTAYSLSLAFATLFLNRTNRSGILNAGPIGGYAQDGEWKLDVRFDKEVIIAKIDSIAKEKERIAVLSFRRLKEQYGQDYKGGILLIDELDATLYGFSQEKLVEYLWQAAGIYKIQIVFTTHSPIILKCVNKCQRKERQERGITFPPTIIKSYLRQPSVETKRFGRGRSVATEPSKSRGVRRLHWVSKSASDFDIIFSCGQRITFSSMWLLSTFVRV